jgi:hypothetical protein
MNLAETAKAKTIIWLENKSDSFFPFQFGREAYPISFNNMLIQKTHSFPTFPSQGLNIRVYDMFPDSYPLSGSRTREHVNIHANRSGNFQIRQFWDIQ